MSKNETAVHPQNLHFAICCEKQIKDRGLATKYHPGYFTIKAVHEVPSVTTTGYKQGMRCTSVGVQTDEWKPRVVKSPQRYAGFSPEVVNLSYWEHTPMASLDFVRPTVRLHKIATIFKLALWLQK